MSKCGSIGLDGILGYNNQLTFQFEPIKQEHFELIWNGSILKWVQNYKCSKFLLIANVKIFRNGISCNKQ